MITRSYFIVELRTAHAPDGDPLAEKLNTMTKYVVAPTLTETDLSWNNTVQIKDDITKKITELKEKPGDILVYGSAQLVQTLFQHNLVDEYHLQLHPIVVSMGKQLFSAWP
jgi:dihydrofolate reductase